VKPADQASEAEELTLFECPISGTEETLEDAIAHALGTRRLSRLPTTLIIAMDRQADGDKPKVMKQVILPFELDARPWVEDALREKMNPIADYLSDALDRRDHRNREKRELDSKVHPDIKRDEGANFSGLYQLCGIIAHKGERMDTGHYKAFVARSPLDISFGYDDDDCDWCEMDDEQVSVVSNSDITELQGSETMDADSEFVAYILVYREQRLD